MTRWKVDRRSTHKQAVIRGVAVSETAGLSLQTIHEAVGKCKIQTSTKRQTVPKA